MIQLERRKYCTKGLHEIYDGKDWEELLEDFQQKIDYNVQKLPKHERDDLEQEIKLKIIEKLNVLIRDNSTLGFWGFLNQLKENE